MPKVTLPPELAGVAPELARDRRFLRLLHAGRSWRPPALVLRFAVRLGHAWSADAVAIAAANAGWQGIGRPWRILVALVAVLWARYGRRGHLRGPGIWVIKDTTPRRLSAPESALRTSWGASPAGPGPEALVSEPSMPEAPPPSRPRPGSDGIVHG